MENTFSEQDIAVIGLACRFPGAKGPDEYWQNLRDGKESTTLLTDEMLQQAGVASEHIADPRYVKSGFFLDKPESFDAPFFGFSPRDAQILDPQHRHFLECAWEAFEDAGYDPLEYDGAVGVFAGSGHNAYMPYNLLNNKQLLDEVGFFLLRHTGNDKDFLATRVSYLLNLKGPSINVQTACSTSLVAMHMGIQSLLNAECDMVLAGGVTIELPHKTGYLYKENEILSPDGHCRPFDAASQGTVFGSGAGCILLKRLEDAIEQNDNIQAIIKSSAINNDGAGKTSYLAPSVDGQASAISEALELAEIDAESVGLIECHGTGTPIGDPIEVTALTQAYARDTMSGDQCALGSVKSNIGHTDTAAGIASMIKVVQSLKHKQIPATLHYEKPNPALDLENTPFFVNNTLQPWTTHSGQPRRAGVSSLGVGGTNAHIIVEEAPNTRELQEQEQPRLFLLSAKTEVSLQKNIAALAEYLDENPDVPTTDVAYTLAAGRAHFQYRRSFIAQNKTELVRLLEQASIDSATSKASKQKRPIVFMFAGGGTQYVNMGRELYLTQDVYRDIIDECLQELLTTHQLDLRDQLFRDADAVHQTSGIQRPGVALPLLFITQYAQARLWISQGIVPDAIIGHSMGENTAACLSGVLSLKDAIGLVVLRGQLFEKVDAGKMVSVSMDAELLKAHTDALSLDIAAVNADGLCVASGESDVVDTLVDKLSTMEIETQPIHIDVAAHSRMLDPILEPFSEYLNSITLNKPTIPFVSNRSGQWIEDSEATSAEYWTGHLRHTVNFAQGLDTLSEHDDYVYLEVGPGRTLSSLTKVHCTGLDKNSVVVSMPHADDPADGVEFMLQALANCWQAGGKIAWETYYASADARRTSLPTYQFDETRYWIDPVEPAAGATNSRALSTEGMCYQPVWHRSQLRRTEENGTEQGRVWLIGDQSDLSTQITHDLENRSFSVERLSPSENYSDTGTFTFRLSHPDDISQLSARLMENELTPDYILHTLSLELTPHASHQSMGKAQVRCFDSLMQVARAVSAADIKSTIPMHIVTCAAQSIAGEAVSNPLQTLASGACEVISSEIPELACRVVDLQSRNTDPGSDQKTSKQLVAELLGTSDATSIAYRGSGRFVQNFDAMDPQAINNAADFSLCTNGVYLITGGMGGLGLALAKELANKAPCTLLLLGRREFPAREQWLEPIVQLGEHSVALQAVRDIEKLGSVVVPLQCDIADAQQLQQVKDNAEKRFGKVQGIFHTAGVVKDSIIALKSAREVNAVFSSKVAGTLAIEKVFNLDELDFLVLYSSTSSHAGLIGQIDYAAANSFLNGFAHYQQATLQRNVVSINWPAWQETGIAAKAAGATEAAAIDIDTSRHPLLASKIIDEHDHVSFVSALSVDSYWILDEHRLADHSALIPGSGFMEIARAAFADVTGCEQINLTQSRFLLPFMVSDSESVLLRIDLKAQNGKSVADGCEFSILSIRGSETIEHATGQLTKAEPLPHTTEPEAIKHRCNISTQLFSDPNHHPGLIFGDRWASLKKINIGNSEALLELILDKHYETDLDHFKLHPALLDMAVGGAQVIIPDYEPTSDFYVPVEYGSLQINGSFPCESYSHVVFKGLTSEPSITARFDIDVFDKTGTVFLQVRDFVIQKIPAAAKKPVNEQNTINPVLKRTLEMGITTSEGLDALFTVLASDTGAQVIISPYGVDYSVKELRTIQNPERATSQQSSIHDSHNPDEDAVIPDIENILNRHEAVEYVAVRSFLTESEDIRRVAFFKTDDWESLTVSELRRYAREHLDAQTVPAYFVEIDEIPELVDGKPDRSTLADPFKPADSYVAPRTETERELVLIWSDALGINRVSIEDNFLDIGGHSLLSIRVISKIKQQFGVELDQAKMAIQTLEQLSSDIDSQLPERTTGETESTEHNAIADSKTAQIETADLPDTDNVVIESNKKRSFISSLFGD